MRPRVKLYELQPKSIHPLDCPAPDHAFPSSYPPQCSYDPFPVKKGVIQFDISQWPRRSSRATNRARQRIAISDLVTLFHQLNVRDDTTLPRSRAKQGSLLESSLTATRPFTVKPPPAPLPSLVPTFAVGPFTFIPAAPVTRASATALRTFDLWGFQSRPVTLVPMQASGPTTLLGRRRMAPLPRRACLHSNSQQRAMTPTLSEPSISSPSSRSTSFSWETTSPC